MAYTVPKLKSFTPAALDKAVEKLLAALQEEASTVKSEADWKTFRDRWMARLDRRHPGYGFSKHKGYGTAEHLKALSTLGPSPIHRRTYAPVQALLRPEMR